jgi:hypothetical protein
MVMTFFRAGVVTTATEPLQHQGYEEDGTVDIDD